MFNQISNWLGQGVFTPLFKTFLRSDIPSYYKIFLTAYMFSYTSGGAYLLVFTIAALARILDSEEEINFIYSFNSAGVLILSILVYYVIGYTTFLIAMVKMHWANKNLLFPKYRERGICYLIYKKIRYSMMFQILFYTVMGNYFFLGSMDHLMGRTQVVSATNKESINIGRCTAFMDMIRFNLGSYAIALYMLGLAYLTVLETVEWDYTAIPFGDDLVSSILFAGPPALIAVTSVIVPIILNPYILGWPFYPPFGGCCGGKKRREKSEKWEKAGTPRTQRSSNGLVDLNTFMASTADQKLGKEMVRVANKPDVELGSLATYEIGGATKYGMSIAGELQKSRPREPPARKSKKVTQSRRSSAKAAI